jgi:hypothetical protein
MLKHMQLNSNNEISWIYSNNAGSGELKKIWQLKDNFLENSGNSNSNKFKIKGAFSEKVGTFGTLAREQDAVTNLLEQYMALTEEQKKGYNAQTVKVYIENFRTDMRSNLYNGNYEGVAERGVKGNELPLATRQLLGKCLDQLDNLYKGFDSISVTQEVNKFYDWFINVEQLYYDWRINSVSRAALVNQLNKIKQIRYPFQLPPMVPEGEEVTEEKVVIRGPDSMDSAQMKAMMDKIKEALAKIKPIVDGLSEVNPVALMSANQMAITGVKADLGAATTLLTKAKNAKEFWSEDDYSTCKKIIDELLVVANEISAKKTNALTGEEVIRWKNALANSAEISGMASSAAYFPRVDGHIGDIVNYINLFNITLPNNGAMDGYKVLGQRYGFTGDCDRDQVAVIRMMDNIRVTIEEEFRGANEDRGSGLLAAKLSGRAVKFAVKDIMEDGYCMRKYHQAWLDFERYSSFLVSNFICQNTTKNIKTLNGIQTIEDAFNENTLMVLRNIQTGTSYGGSLLQLELKAVKEGSGDGWKLSQQKLPMVIPTGYTQIDYNTQEMDYGLDCLRVYEEYFGNYLSPLQRTRQYMLAQGAYLNVMNYVHGLVEEHGDWKRDSAENEALRTKLTQLQGTDLYQQVDMSYVIRMAQANATDQNNAAKEAMGTRYCAQIGATVNGSAGTLVDYISTLCQGLVSYSKYEDPEMIYEDRLKALDGAVSNALGGGRGHQVIFGVARNTLLPGGTVIANKDQMKTLINQLETLVKSWNRSDEATTQKVFQEMNKDGVYFLQGADYVYQGTSVDKSCYPREGKVKTIAGDTTTLETCSEGSVTETETKATVNTVRHRILTNELLDVIDELRSLYINSEAIAKVSETKNQLQMAECYHAIVGTAGRNNTWHAPDSTLENGKFLRNDGCYTFQVETQYYICGMAKGELKIAKVSASDVTDSALRRKNADWFDELVDEKGIYYQFTSNDKTLSNAAFSVEVEGRTYTSRGSAIWDDLGNLIITDKDGFLLDSNGQRIVKTVNANSDANYMAYRVDVISQELLVVAYDPGSKKEITGNSSQWERYAMRFAPHSRTMFQQRAKYFIDEDAHALFVEDLTGVSVSMGIAYEQLKRQFSDEAAQGKTGELAGKIAQYAAMFSTLVDTMSLHDVRRYREKLAYEDEEKMLRRVNTVLKNLNADKDFENFANIATQAKEYYEAINEVAIAKSIGNVERAEQALPELEPKKQEYENAKLNGALDRGNFPAYVKSMGRDLEQKASQLKYQLSIITDMSRRAETIIGYNYLAKKYEMAQRIYTLVMGIDSVAEEMEKLLANEGLREDFGDLVVLIRDGNSKYGDRPVLSLAEVWGEEKDAKLCVYQGWRGDSRDAILYQSTLIEFNRRTYFQKSEELQVIASDGVREYVKRMNKALDPYIEDLKKYEAYDGLLNDVYVMDVVKDGRRRKIAGQGFNGLVKKHTNWFITSSRKAAFLSGLNALATDLDWIIQSYDKGGELEGQMDAVLLKKIKNFKEYLGKKNDKRKTTYIGRVIDFEAYDATKMRQEQILYKIQSIELGEIIGQYQEKKLNFEAYKEKIGKLALPQNGPLNDHIEKLRDYLDYRQQLDIYQQSLLKLRPKPYVFFEDGWKAKAELTKDQLGLVKSGTYYRSIWGYGENGAPIFIEEYDPSDKIVDPVYVHEDSLWHGEYAHYGIIFYLMAILYEKFTTQKNLLADLLEEIQKNNEKMQEANEYLAKINKVQARAAKQGDKAREVIPADVIVYFKQKGITMPGEYFSNSAELVTYQNSNFNKRMDFLSKKGKDISYLLSYLSQGKMKVGENASESIMLGSLSNRDLLELGTLKEIYDQTDYIGEKYGDTSAKAANGDTGMIIGLVFIAIAAAVLMAIAIVFTGGALFVLLAAAAAAAMGTVIGVAIEMGIAGSGKTFHGCDQLYAGEDNNLLEAYWMNRNKSKTNDSSVQIKSTLNAYTEGIFQQIGDTQPWPCTLEGIVGNKKCPNGSATNGFQLPGWAPTSNGWGLTGHYTYLAGKMADASGQSSGDFANGANQLLVESFDLLAHQKFFGRDKGVYKENFTEPDYDYNALILMYKLEALASLYGDIVATATVNYLTGKIKKPALIQTLNAMKDPALGDQALQEEDVQLIKSYIDGPNLFTEDEDIPDYEKKTLTQCWTENDSIKNVLNKLYGDGSSGLNADEISLWSESMRTHIDKISTDGQTLSTKMQRMMQRCNETTSLATQMLRSLGDVWKQFVGNVRA